MARGIRSALGGIDIRILPIADGGDGSVDCLVSAGYARHEFTARGPTALDVGSSLALRDGTAVVEVANTCGMTLLPGGVLEPLSSSTVGLGDAIIAALDLGADEIVVCLGGSASTDGGAGMLTALGAAAQDAQGRAVIPTGGTLGSITHLDLTGLDPRLARTRFTMAADVDSPLFGDLGAAAVFATQKGADKATVELLDLSLRSWANVLAQTTGTDACDEPGAGAAGGTGAAVLSVLGAARVSGSMYFLSELGLADALRWSDVLVTGEGRLDEQSALGKGALAVVAMARAADVPALVICGEVAIGDDELTRLGVSAGGSVIAAADDAHDAIRRADELLATATARTVAAWST